MVRSCARRCDIVQGVGGSAMFVKVLVVSQLPASVHC